MVEERSQLACALTGLAIGSAQDVAKSRGHKNVAAADVLKALEMIEFSDFAVRLEDDLEGEYPISTETYGSILKILFWLSISRRRQEIKTTGLDDDQEKIKHQRRGRIQRQNQRRTWYHIGCEAATSSWRRYKHDTWGRRRADGREGAE